MWEVKRHQSVRMARQSVSSATAAVEPPSSTWPAKTDRGRCAQHGSGPTMTTEMKTIPEEGSSGSSLKSIFKNTDTDPMQRGLQADVSDEVIQPLKKSPDISLTGRFGAESNGGSSPSHLWFTG